MTTFTSSGGINLNYDVLGGPGEAVVCLPGGPLSAPRYLGDLGGLDASRKLVLLELPPKRVDRIVADLEALRTQDRKSTRLNSSHTEIYTLSLHDALPISRRPGWAGRIPQAGPAGTATQACRSDRR